MKIGVIHKKINQYSIVKEPGRVESLAVLLPKSTSSSKEDVNTLVGNALLKL